MTSRSRRWILRISALVTVAGAVTTFVYFLQPWRSCDYEDTSTGCVMLPADAAVMMIAALVTAVALLATITALIFQADAERQARSERS
jgi:hypothetical protein